MKRAFLFLAVAMLYCNPTLAQEPDPNLLWKTENSYHRFLVHPNGNILAGKGYVDEGGFESELDGNTGTLIRKFEFPLYFFDISPDGNYISAMDESTQRCVLDYETGEVIARLTKDETYPKFLPDNRTLVYAFIEPIGELNGNTRLQSYNFESGEYKTSENLIRYTTTRMIAVSPDGKYIATGGAYFGPAGKNYIRLILWDAQTLEPIKLLGEFENSREVRSIKFSPDSKLVGFNVYYGELYIYKTDDYSLLRHYSPQIDVEHDVNGFCFLPNNLLAFGNVIHGGSTDPNYIKIENLNTAKLLYNNRIIGSFGMEYNQRYNSLLTNFYNISSFNLEGILSNIVESEILNPFTLQYENNTLIIRNYIFNSIQLTGQLLDIQGKLIRNMNLNTSSNEIRIPIKLLRGTYFLHIKDGGKEYVAKFLVVN